MDYTQEIKQIIQESEELINDLPLDMPLSNLGVDSLSLVSIVYLLEEKYQIEINPEDIEAKTSLTINALNDIVNSKLGTT